MTIARGSFQLKSWDEDAYDEGDTGKLTMASVTQEFSGDIVGSGAVRWLMAYRPDGTARFLGFQKVSGSVGGRQGSFVLETAGDFDGTMARWTATVVPGSGTGQLGDLTGSGQFGAVHGPEATYEMELETP